MNKKIIIDTDPGVDDAMALMLAVKSQAFDILAVTTVGGNSTIENTTRNARYIMNLLETDVPVYSGAAKPLKQLLWQSVVHGTSGLDGIDPKNDPKLTNDAVEKIISLVNENPSDVTIVALGPLSNIARAIQQNPEAMKKVKEIIMMGGAINVPGNMNRVAEFNIFVDPDAAKIVFDFPIKKTLVPLDACNQVQLTLADFESMKKSPMKDVLLKMADKYITNLEKDAGVKAAIMYDPLTIFYLLEPDACETIEDNVEVETAGEITRGMTVIDKRLVKDGKQPNLTLVTSVTQAAFKKTFLNM